MTPLRPAWSRQSMVLRLPRGRRLADFDPTLVFGDSRGEGVRIAVIDSGIEADHPLLGGAVDQDGSVEFSVDESGAVERRDGPHCDVYGHGTACAGIIHALAPAASITSVKVLDQSLRGRAAAFHAGLQWAVNQQFEVINLSLGAGRKEWALAFHELCDRAYFNNSFIVTAANNIQRDSYPSLFASVTSVAANTSLDPLRFHFNPEPPTEFLARGIDVEVPWLNGTTITTTGNSFAAPHIAAMACLIKGEHPDLRPFQVKTALWAASANVRESSTVERAGRHPTVGTQIINKPDRQPMPTQDDQNQTRQRPDQITDTERDLIERLVPDARVEKLIRTDRFGSLYLATTNRGRMAIRRLESGLSSQQVTRTRVRKTIARLAQIKHPHIVAILGAYDASSATSWNPDLVWTMPYFAEDLDAHASDQPLEPAASVAAVVSVLSAIQAVHNVGMVCGDVRPGNICVDHSGRLLLAEPGLASAIADPLSLEFTELDPEHWSRMAPEQLEGSAPDRSSDIYAAGLLLFQLLAGYLPFPPVQSMAALVSQRARERPRSLTDLAPHVPIQMAEVADISVATNPNLRFHTAHEFTGKLISAANSWLGPDWHLSQPYFLRTTE